GAVDVLQLVETEETDAEGTEIRGFVAHQRYTGGRLQAYLRELAAVVDASIAGVAHHHAWCFKARCRQTLEALARNCGASTAAQFQLSVLQFSEADGFRFQHGGAEETQGIGRHSGVVSMAAVFVGLHDLAPFLEVRSEAAALCGFEGGFSTLGHHHETTARRSAPAFLRGADQEVHTECLHVDPDGAGGDAVEDEETTNGVRGFSNGLDVVVRQDQASGGFHVRCKYYSRLFFGDGGN